MKMFSMFLLSLIATAIEAIQHPPHLETSPHPNFSLLPRDTAGNGTFKNWQWSDQKDLGKNQLYWINRKPNPEFDLAVARQMAASLRTDPKAVCGVKQDGKCLIAACDSDTNMGLYLCNYRPQGFETACHIIAHTATKIIDRWEGKEKGGMLIAGFTEPSVQAYSYWSEDPSWVVVYTMPCLQTVPM
ncbi:hypothetical protein TWF506_009383 [Arthrobotrys conoides]|uniref:Uncharacterized protein n=1 Tax=Arthrobotrys conoides TaxID=74498 RepID=A0AAN8NDN5_9PEZI